jgi:L-rhamnose isomerase
MADIENLVLEQPRPIRGQLDRIAFRLDDPTSRVGHIERAIADHSVRFAEVNIKLDRLDARVDRIEKRLDLVDAP